MYDQESIKDNANFADYKQMSEWYLWRKRRAIQPRVLTCLHRRLEAIGADWPMACTRLCANVIGPWRPIAAWAACLQSSLGFRTVSNGRYYISSRLSYNLLLLLLLFFYSSVWIPALLVLRRCLLERDWLSNASALCRSVWNSAQIQCIQRRLRFQPTQAYRCMHVCGSRRFTIIRPDSLSI